MTVQELRFLKESCQVDRVLLNFRRMRSARSHIKGLAGRQPLHDFMNMNSGLSDLRMKVLSFGGGDHCPNAVRQLSKGADMRKRFHRVKDDRCVCGGIIALTVISPVVQPVRGAQNVGSGKQVKTIPERLSHRIESDRMPMILVRKNLKWHGHPGLFPDAFDRCLQ